MTLPFNDIFEASGSVDRAVLLSEKSQLLAIKLLQIAEDRSEWDGLTDSEWDELEGAIGDAETEILTQIEGLPMLTEFKHALKTNTQALTGGAEASVLFNSGDHEPNPQGNRIKPGTGKVSITGFAYVTAGTATQLTLAIHKNGSDIVRQTFANTATSQKMSISVVDDCDADDYYELRVLTNQSSTIQNSEVAYLKWIRWYEP